MWFNSEKWYKEKISEQDKIAAETLIKIEEMKIRFENDQKHDSEVIEKINSIKAEIKRLKEERKLNFGY